MLENLYEVLEILDDLETCGAYDQVQTEKAQNLIADYIANLNLNTLFGLTNQYNDFESANGVEYTIQKHTDGGSISIYPKNVGDFEPITIPAFLGKDIVSTVLDSDKSVSLYLKDDVKEMFGLKSYRNYKLIVDSETFETLEVRDTDKPELKGFKGNFTKYEVGDITFTNHLTLEMFRIV